MNRAVDWTEKVAGRVDKDYTQLNPVALLLACLSSEQVVRNVQLGGHATCKRLTKSPPISRKLTAEEIDFFNKHGYLISEKSFWRQRTSRTLKMTIPN